MVFRYGEKGRCWSSFLGACLRNSTLCFGNNLNLSDVKRKTCIFQLCEHVKAQDEMVVQDQKQTVLPEKDPFLPDEFPPLESSLLPQQQVFASAHQQMTSQSPPQVSKAQPISQPESIGADLLQGTATSSSAQSSSSPGNEQSVYYNNVTLYVRTLDDAENTISTGITTEEPVKVQ